MTLNIKIKHVYYLLRQTNYMDTKLNQRFQDFLIRIHQMDDALPPLEKYGISPAQLGYLDFLNKNPGCKQSDLADVFGFKPASISTMISTLEDRGLLTRTKHPLDKRAWRLSLSLKGQRISEEIIAFRTKRIEKLLENLTQEEKESLTKLLDKALPKQ